MARQQIGVVKEVFRYPVKSMLGEKLSECEIDATGLIGDRAYALREPNGRVVTAKRWSQMFEFSARYDAPPTVGELAPLSISLPDGRSISAQAADASSALSAALGHEVVLERAQPDQKSQAGIDPATVFGDIPADEAAPEFGTKTLPDFFPLPPGTFFDSASIHVLATGTLAHMRKLLGEDTELAGEDVQLDPRRFRPNIVVETESGLEGFLEDDWLEGTLEIGQAVAPAVTQGVTIVQLKPALRCVMTTHRQAGLAREMKILRTGVQHHNNKVGVFASIGTPGRVKVGDPVMLNRATEHSYTSSRVVKSPLAPLCQRGGLKMPPL